MSRKSRESQTRSLSPSGSRGDTETSEAESLIMGSKSEAGFIENLALPPPLASSGCRKRWNLA